MIEALLMYTVLCDDCSDSADANTEHVAWRDAETAREAALDNGYASINGRDFCPRCRVRIEGGGDE